MYSDTPHTTVQPWESDVALFINWDTLKSSLQRRGLQPDPSILIDMASNFGRLVSAKAYADWTDSHSSEPAEMADLYDAGLEPVFVQPTSDAEPPRYRHHQNDLKLSIDCMECSFITPHIGTFVLASGSLHHPFLIQSLRNRGFQVILVGVSWNPPRTSGCAVDDLLLYDQFLGHRDAPPSASPVASLHQESMEELDRVLEEMVSLIREQRRQGRVPLLSWLGHQLRRHVNGFNPQAYGFDKFKDLVRHAEERGLLRIVTQGLLDWALLPDDSHSGDESEDDAPATHLLPPDSPGHSPSEHKGAHPILEADHPLESFRDVFEDLVRGADEIESDPRYPFMTPGFLGQCLWRKGHWEVNSLPPGSIEVSSTLKNLRAGQIRKLVDYAVEEGLLLGTDRFDDETRKSFVTIHLNRTHPFVEAALLPASMEETGSIDDEPAEEVDTTEDLDEVNE